MSVSVDMVRGEIARLMEPAGDDAWAWVREMFTDRAIVEIERPDEELQLLEVTWSLDGDDLEDLELGDPTEVTLEYVAKAEGGPRLAGPIVRKDAAKKIAYSAVLVPGEPDADGETLSAEKVEEVAHGWLEQFRAFDVQHSVKQVEVSPVESYIEPADRTVQIDGEDVVLPAGTWTVAAKFADDEAWEQVTEGERTGLSIMGVPSDQLEAALAAVKSGTAPAMKRVTLADVGGGDPNGDWFAPFIGIVDQPAVPKAKFYAFKQAPGRRGLGQRLADALRGAPAAPKEGRRFSAQTYRRLQEAQEAVAALVAEAEQEQETRAGKAHDPANEEDSVKTEDVEKVAGAVKAALGLNDDETLDDKIAGAVKEQLEQGSGGGDGDEGGDEGTEDEVFSEAQIAQIKELIDPVAEKADRAEKRSRPGSRQPGDDPDEPVHPAFKAGPERDAFGQVIRA